MSAHRSFFTIGGSPKRPPIRRKGLPHGENDPTKDERPPHNILFQGEQAPTLVPPLRAPMLNIVIFGGLKYRRIKELQRKVAMIQNFKHTRLIPKR